MQELYVASQVLLHVSTVAASTQYVPGQTLEQFASSHASNTSRHAMEQLFAPGAQGTSQS